MIRCPKCSSPNHESNHLPELTLDHASMAAAAIKGGGGKFLALAPFAYRAGAQFLNTMRPPHRCKDCNNRF